MTKLLAKNKSLSAGIFMKKSLKNKNRRMAIGSWEYMWQAAAFLFACVSIFSFLIGLFTYISLCIFHGLSPVLPWGSMSSLQQSIIGSLILIVCLFSLLMTLLLIMLYDRLIYSPVKYLLGEVGNITGDRELSDNVDQYLRGGKKSLFDLYNPRKSWVERVQEYVNRASSERYFDEITGCFNRKYFSQVLTEILKTHILCSLSQRMIPRTNANICYGMYLIDIDHFKQINDEFGHMYGDQVLALVGQTLRSVIGSEGVVVRNGGEEFLIIVCKNYPMNYSVLAEKIRKEFCDGVYVTYLKTQEIRPLTCSVGFVPFPLFENSQTRISVQQHVDLADQAMYMAKNCGRNTWRGIEPLFPPLLEEEIQRSAASVEYGIQAGYFRMDEPNLFDLV